MVEIFCKRKELMPSDESIDQHNKKRAEEIADVDKDKNSPEGLFKGTFIIGPVAELLFDEADGVMRCPHCQHEHEGGPLCTVCGTRFALEGDYSDDGEGYGFSDIDDEADLDLADLEVDVGGEFRAAHFHHFLGRMPPFPFPAHGFHHMHHHHEHDESLGGSSDSDLDAYSDEDEDDDDEEDEGSLQDFVVRDEEQNHDQSQANGRNNRQPITISDDESDEGGAVSNRRRRPDRRSVASIPSTPSVVTAETDSENGEANAEAEMLRRNGWSPLDTENDESDGEENLHYAYRGRYEVTDDEPNSEDESDTNTMRNEASDDDDDHSRDDVSETPTYQYNGNRYMLDHDTPNSYTSEDDYGHSEAEFPSMDRDGDTEMSASPGPLSRSVSVSANMGYDGGETYGYDDEGTPRGDRGESASTNFGENLGAANEVHEVHEAEYDSSDSSIQPPPRRRPRGYNPRISMMFAEHQLSLRGAQNRQSGLDELEVARAEPASRNRRMTAYRLQPARRVDPLRSSRSPSATRIISSSNRIARPPRQYQRRYH
jgi:hypothetical protein